jgi:hypothetical protein
MSGVPAAWRCRFQLWIWIIKIAQYKAVTVLTFSITYKLY